LISFVAQNAPQDDNVFLEGLEGKFDGGEVVAVLGFDHFVGVGPVKCGETVGGLGNGIGGEPGNFAGGFGGGERFVEFGFRGGTPAKTLGKAGPLLKKFGGAVVGPIGAPAERSGIGRLERLDDANEMGLRTGVATGAMACPFFRVHEIGEKAGVEFGGRKRVRGADGAVRAFHRGGIDVRAGEKTFGGGEAGEVVGLQRHGVEPPEPVMGAPENRIRQAKGGWSRVCPES
jgi:hypothetical protein